MTTMVDTWERLREGQDLPVFVAAPLTITDFVRYQGAANDRNPIHHDADFARRAAYPGPFAVGMLAASVLANYAADRSGRVTCAATRRCSGSRPGPATS
jgi:acyl dehydratase